MSPDVAAADDQLIQRIETAVLAAAGGREGFRRKVPPLFRLAIDEVIDARRTGRFTIEELEKTEKTYLGTKIEIMLRNCLGLSRGIKLDLMIEGVEVDVKNTIGKNWTIPLEADKHPCILIRTNERDATCWFGLLVIRAEYLNESKNRDQKRSISTRGREQIHWMLAGEKYPANIWEERHAGLDAVKKAGGGTERVAALFEVMQGRKISRDVVESLAQQKDYMKRIRRNGGARDLLARKGIAILWGRKDHELISQLGLPECTAEEFISFKAEESAHIDLLRRAGHID